MPGESGAVIMRDPNTHVFAVDTDMAKDIAVFRLDDPPGPATGVPTSIARPLRLPANPGECPNGFTGWIVGYGDSFFDPIDEAETCADGFGEVRRFRDSFPWNSQGVATGSVYRTVFQFGVLQPCSYHGPTFGDSGGPLLDLATLPDTVCGVGSIVVPLLIFPTWIVVPVYAGVDSSETLGFLSSAFTSTGQPLVGADGNLEGTCPVFEKACDLAVNIAYCDFLQSQDVDGDEIMDMCDNCPTVFNYEQRTVGDDPDGNGHGAACDFCPGKTYPGPGPIGNCNYEAELASAYPFSSKPPTLGPNATPAQKQKYKAAFRPNVCDDIPCPKTTNVKQGNSFPFQMQPEVKNCFQSLPVPGCNCTFPPPKTCAWNVVDAKTTIQFMPQVNSSKNTTHPLGTDVKVGLRICPCSGNTQSIAGRVACQIGGCTLDEFSYDNNNNPMWMEVGTEPQPGGWSCIPLNTHDTNPVACTDFGREFSMKLGELSNNTIKHEVRWNFQALPFVMDTFKQLINNVPGGLVKRKARAVVLAKIVQVDGQRPSATVLPRYFELAQTLYSGDQQIELVDNAQELEKALSINDFTYLIKRFWNNCPDERTPVGVFASDTRLYSVGTDGVETLLDPPQGLEALAQQVQSGSLTFVAASEPLATLATRSLPSLPILSGVTFDTAAAEVVHALESDGIDALPSVLGRGPCGVNCSPVFMGNEGLALSGTFRRLLAIGGTDDGTPTGVPHASAWILDVDVNSWLEVPLEPADRVASVLAATYRAEDFSVYLLDDDGSHVRLRRYLPRGSMHGIAELPGSWDKYLGKVLLVAGQGRDVVLAASKADEGKVMVCHEPNTKTLEIDAGSVSSHQGHGDALGPCPGDELGAGGAKRTIVARFTVEPGGSVSFGGRIELGARLLAPPIIDGDSLVLTVRHASGAALRTIAMSELTMPPASQSPTML